MTTLERIIVSIALAVMLVCGYKLANADMLELRELCLTYTKYADVNYSAYFPQRAKDGIAMESKTDLFHYGFLNTLVHGTSDESQYRHVGLQLDLGVRIGKLDVYARHHSQHILDRGEYYDRHFPVSDSVNVKLYLYGRD